MISAESVAKSKAATINVETHSPKNKFTFHYWLPDLKLTTEDKKILLNPVGKLTDNIINAAQTLLRAQYPHVPGMQDVVCGVALSFDVQPEEFVQILNTQTEHWLTVSSIGCQHPTVNVYDSMFRSAGTKTKAQIACILHTQQKQIKLNLMSVHIQAGGSDCGLFAIANATALCCGENPGKYLYEQQLMREHLCKCFESRKMSFFPVKKYRRPQYHATVINEEFFEVFCLCRMPEMFVNENWVECSKCSEWFHFDTCVSISEKARKPSSIWHCDSCKSCDTMPHS